MAIRNRSRVGGLAIAAAIAVPILMLSPRTASAQQPSDCTLPEERGGLIRGDRVPNGCVLQSQGPPSYSPLWRVADAPDRRYEYRRFFPAGIPVFLDLNPVVVVKSRSRRGIGPQRRPDGRLPRRPRSVRGGNFGPIFHPFGPVLRPFGRVVMPAPPRR